MTCDHDNRRWRLHVPPMPVDPLVCDSCLVPLLDALTLLQNPVMMYVEQVES